jgi:hypothetical protein
VKKSRFLSKLTFLMAGLQTAIAASSSKPQIWLAADDPVVQAQKHKNEPVDYMDLFKPESPWGSPGTRLEAFKISTQMALRGSDEQLRTVIEGLKARHVKLAIEMGLISGPGSGQCGMHVEGYSSPGGPETAARRIKALGGEIDYAAMDEPVWWGHVAGELSGGRRGCGYSIDDLSSKLAPQIEMLHRYFPNIRIGDIEPINTSPHATGMDPRYIDNLTAFMDLLQKITGMKPAFLHADVAWKWEWRSEMEEMARQAHARGIRFGVICDGDPDAGGNEAWVRQALQRCQQVLADPSISPDDLIVQSWEPLPTKMLPETDPGALTYEVGALSKRLH